MVDQIFITNFYESPNRVVFDENYYIELGDLVNLPQ